MEKQTLTFQRAYVCSFFLPVHDQILNYHITSSNQAQWRDAELDVLLISGNVSSVEIIKLRCNKKKGKAEFY